MNNVQNHVRLNMNILKKMIIGLILAANSSLLCGEVNKLSAQAYDGRVKNDYSYWGYGAGIPTIFSAKFGHRHQLDKHGFEYGVGATPLVYVTEAHLFGTYLYYPKPSLSSQMYFGIGLRGGGFLEMKRAKFAYIAPGIVVGREFTKRSGERRFIQFAVGPGGLTTEGPLKFRSISLAFGYGF